uniref:Coronin n=1 Tax=Schistocephalus solidus TaxID=70667 RepID=A0A0X3NY91_SCHSO
MFVRKSKFKHIIGKPNKKEFCYDDIRITKSSWDSTYCSVNPKYVAIITEAAGGGAFLVLPVEKYGRVERDAPLVAGHRAAVLDIEWCPHNDDLIASGSEDCTAKVWQIPEGGLEPKVNLTTPVADLVAHQRRVGLVRWHPTAEYVLLTAGADNMVFLWNVSTEEKLVTISFPDMVLSASFNFDGSKLVTTCKDRHTRVMDPRKGEILKENICHPGTKPQQAVYLKNGRIFTTGFSPMSERQYALWDVDDVTKQLQCQDLDTSNGLLFPFYDPDSNLIFLVGKGDCSIRYFEITDEEPFVYFIDTLTSTDPQRGMGWMPKRGLDVNQNEIARFYKLHAKGLCEVISFTVPRKSVLYQDDLYPDTVSDMPALSAEEWMSGKNAPPLLMSLKDSFVSKEKNTKKNGKLPLSRPRPSLHQPAKDSPTEGSARKLGGTMTPSLATESTRPVSTVGDGEKPASTGAAACGINPADVQQLLDDMRKMKIIIKGHERRIKQLEERQK